MPDANTGLAATGSAHPHARTRPGFMTGRIPTGIRMCSVLVLLFSVSLIPPVLVAMQFGEATQVHTYINAMLLLVGTGVGGLLATRQKSTPLRQRDGFLVVVLFWVVFAACGAVPFVIDTGVHMRFVDAMFESVSGITTTGASVLSGLDAQPRSIIYYRAQLNFLGGLGIVVLAMALLPYLGVGGAKLYQSETPGPMKEDRMTPRLADTAKSLWLIYSAITLICALAYHLAGVPWFDAVCYSMATMSLGGFSTHDASLGLYDSAAVEIVGGVFSLLAAANFALYFRMIQTRSIRPWLVDLEFKFFLKVFGVVAAITVVTLWLSGTFAPWEAAYHGFFQAASVFTGNGINTVGYPGGWPAAVCMLLIVSSFFGGCVGSTSGAIKSMRVLLLVREVKREIMQLIHPNAQLSVRLHRRSVPDTAVQAVVTFVSLYMISAGVFTLLLCFTGLDPVSAFATTAGCLNNMGIGYGETGGGFGGINDAAKWLMSLAMIWGRLEVLPVLVILSRSYWRY
ncbi:MAG: potassium transporter [Pseudomonadales bacterium]|jgi:trk system potassium uptake protein TrkH|nr:potassium transporter [Pseudomonadales bacterium]MBP7911265.1 potassium transporter [Pseudomonadales bacterium]